MEGPEQDESGSEGDSGDESESELDEEEASSDEGEQREEPRYYGWVSTCDLRGRNFIGKEEKDKDSTPLLQRCWRDGSPLKYRAVGFNQPMRKQLDPYSEPEAGHIMIIGDECEVLDDFDVGVYSGGTLSPYGQRHVRTVRNGWLSTRRNQQPPVKALTKPKGKKTKGKTQETDTKGVKTAAPKKKQGGKAKQGGKEKQGGKPKVSASKGPKASSSKAATRTGRPAEEEQQPEADRATQLDLESDTRDERAKENDGSALLSEEQLRQPMLLLVCQDGSKVPIRASDIEENISQERAELARAQRAAEEAAKKLQQEEKERAAEAKRQKAKGRVAGKGKKGTQTKSAGVGAAPKTTKKSAKKQPDTQPEAAAVPSAELAVKDKVSIESDTVGAAEPEPEPEQQAELQPEPEPEDGLFSVGSPPSHRPVEPTAPVGMAVSVAETRAGVAAALAEEAEALDSEDEIVEQAVEEDAEAIDAMRRYFREHHSYGRIDGRFQIFAT